MVKGCCKSLEHFLCEGSTNRLQIQCCIREQSSSTLDPKAFRAAVGRDPEYPTSVVSCGLQFKPAFYKIHEHSDPDREKNWSCVGLFDLS